MDRISPRRGIWSPCQFVLTLAAYTDWGDFWSERRTNEFMPLSVVLTQYGRGTTCKCRVVREKLLVRCDSKKTMVSWNLQFNLKEEKLTYVVDLEHSSK